jgi:diguanylate cyclase (GGDEF)-like protein
MWRFLWAAAFVCLLSVAPASFGAMPTSFLKFSSLRAVIPTDMSIVALLQDRQGFIWIGTHNTGLYRYDGYQAVRYAHSPANGSTLPNDQVSALFEDGAGRLWVGTQAGLARYNPHTDDFTVFKAPPGPKNNRLITRIIGDGRGGMWLATWGGLQHFDPVTGKFVQYVHRPGDADSLNSNDVNAIALDHRGGIWVATWPGGIDYLPAGGSKFAHFRVDDSANPDPKLNVVRALFFDRERRLWIGTERGAYRWADGAPWNSRVHLPSPASRINGFYQDRSGTVWAGTTHGGLLRWTGAAEGSEAFVHRPDDPYSVQSDDIRAVMQDRGGLLWVGTFTDGINTVNLNSHGFRRLLPNRANESPPGVGNAFSTIAGAPDDRLWLGSRRGFSLFDPYSGATLLRYFHDPGAQGQMAVKSVYSMFQQPGGELWLGTSAGLHAFTATTRQFRAFNFGKGAGNYINKVTPGRNGTLWLGTGRNLVWFDPANGTHRVFAHDDGDARSLSLTGITSILEDRLGRVWIGSEWSNGLNMLDPATGRVQHFYFDKRNKDGLSDDKITTIFESREGRIWLGTSVGLSEIVTSGTGGIGFRSHDAVSSGGPTKVISIAQDQGGTLWVATVTGLLALDTNTGAVKKYGASDGMTDGFTIGASGAGADGMLYFGSLQGVTVVDPPRVGRTVHTPQVSITDIGVGRRSLREAPRPPGVVLEGAVTDPSMLALPPDVSVFSVTFAALDFTSPADNRYQYKLTGFDKDWTDADASRRSASYTNLDPGDYLFEVRAMNAAGLWSDRADELRITILPPFWKTTWFRLVSLWLLVAFFAVIYRLRIGTLKRTQARLQQLVLERTRALEDSNAKLAVLSRTDGLTGLTNRRGFDSALAAEWIRSTRSGEPIALAMVDVDFFKLYNDHYGHQAGDHCLKEVATAIASHLHRAGDLAARYGGEEFVLLMPGSDGPDALKIASALCERVFALGLPHALSNHAAVSVSIGVFSIDPSSGSTAQDLIEAADRALYAAKQAGRNCARLAS